MVYEKRRMQSSLHDTNKGRRRLILRRFPSWRVQVCNLNPDFDSESVDPLIMRSKQINVGFKLQT